MPMSRRRKQPYFEEEPGAPAPICVTVQHKVMFSEVDALAIGWHGHALRLFELAQTELMDKIGLTYQRYQEVGIGAPMATAHADYLLPTMLDDILEITAILHWHEGARLNIEYRVVNERGELCITGYTVQMLFDYATHEPFFFAPPILAEMQERWKRGEFHA